MLLQNVWVRYRVPFQKTRSFKEYAIHRLTRGLGYQDYWALRGVSLTVTPREIVGIIGRNGAGKTTLLRVVARVMRPSTGRVRVVGEVAPLLALGAGFQQELTGRENILLNGVALGRSTAELSRSMDAIIEFAGIGEFIDAPLRTYSTGMKARLGFAVATARRPDVLLVDEVLAVGDAEFRAKCERRIAAFREAGTTILIVSHFPKALVNLCDRLVWLEAGKVRAKGPPGEIVAEYEKAMGAVRSAAGRDGRRPAAGSPLRAEKGNPS